MKRLILAISVLCIFSVKAWAGDVPTVDYTPPPPPVDTTSRTQVSEPGDIPTADSKTYLESLVIAIAGLMAR